MAAVVEAERSPAGHPVRARPRRPTAMAAYAPRPDPRPSAAAVAAPAVAAAVIQSSPAAAEAPAYWLPEEMLLHCCVHWSLQRCLYAQSTCLSVTNHVLL